jgi:flagellar hook protein FlgE
MSLTMGSATASGRTGLQAASKRVDAAASNIANLRTLAPDTIDIAARPMISLASEFTELTAAKHAFKASIAVIVADNDMLGALFDEEA